MSQGAGHRSEHLVADEVAARVVDVLEVVQVDHQHRDRGLVALGFREGVPGQAVPAGRVEQPGLAVGRRSFLEVLDQNAAVQDVDGRHDQRDHPRSPDHESGGQDADTECDNLKGVVAPAAEEASQ